MAVQHLRESAEDTARRGYGLTDIPTLETLSTDFFVGAAPRCAWACARQGWRGLREA